MSGVVKKPKCRVCRKRFWPDEWAERCGDCRKFVCDNCYLYRNKCGCHYTCERCIGEKYQKKREEFLKERLIKRTQSKLITSQVSSIHEV